jgi:hypothetical protein
VAGLAALVAARPLEDEHAVEVIHLVLDHAGLQARGLDQPVLALLVAGAHAHVHGTLHVDLDARDREAALLQDLAVVARPVDLGIGENDHRGVGAHAVHEQPL